MNDFVAIADEPNGHACVLIPKCAATSIGRAWERHLGIDPAPNVHGRGWPARLDRDELADAAGRLFRWAVVRDPRPRLVSVWAEKLQRRLPEGLPGLSDWLRPMLGRPFAELCRYVCARDPHMGAVDKHVRSMRWFLEHDGKLLVDAWYRLEDLPIVWPTLQARFGLPGLGRENASEHLPWPKYYTAELERMVMRAYAWDTSMAG